MGQRIGFSRSRRYRCASSCNANAVKDSVSRLFYRRTRNLRAVQLLPGHTKLKSNVRHLGMEVDDALEISKQTDV